MGQPSGFRNDYLIKVGNSTVAADGTATATVSPDVGQYWYPTFIRVSSNNTVAPFPLAIVYTGAPTVFDQTTYLDDTNTGQNDTTSICSGMVLQYGEAITAKWSLATPGASVTITVFGLSSTFPTAVGNLIPASPGTHFTGHNPININALLGGNSAANITLATGTSTVLPAVNTFQFSSLILNVDTGCNAPTAYNPVKIVLQWSDSLAGTANSNVIFEQSFEIHARQSGTFPNANGGFFIYHDSVHGKSVSVTIFNNGPNTVTIFDYELTGSNVNVGALYCNEILNPAISPLTGFINQDQILVSVSAAININTTVNFSSRMGPGNLVFVMTAGAQPITFAFQFGSDVNSADTLTQAANSTTHFSYVCPARSIKWAISNGAVGASSYTLRVFRQTYFTM